MKFIITNAQENFINVVVSRTNMGTQTIAHLLGEIYRSNIILRKYVSFNTYQQIVQLSYQDEVLAPNILLKDAFGEQASGESVVTLTLRLTQNLAPIPGISPSDLTLVEPPVIPEDLYCPISGQVFSHPVKYYYGGKKDKDGKIIRENTTCTIEKESLLNTAKTQSKCPFTRLPLSVESVKALETDLEKQKQVADFFDSYKNSSYYKWLKKKQYKETKPLISKTPQSNDPSEPTLDDQAAIQRLLRENNAQRQPVLLAQFQRPRRPTTTLLSPAALPIPISWGSGDMWQRNLNRARNRTSQLLAAQSTPASHSNSANSLPAPSSRERYFVSEQRISITTPLPPVALPPQSTQRPLGQITPHTRRSQHPLMVSPGVAFRSIPSGRRETIDYLTVNHLQATEDIVRETTLKTLYAYGLREDHLRTFQAPPGGYFTIDHSRALAYLIRYNSPRITPREAMQKINGLTEQEAHAIWSERHENEVRLRQPKHRRV